MTDEFSQTFKELKLKVHETYLRFREERGDPGNVYHKQVEFELGVIGNLGFSTIFLICHDLCQYARDNEIRMGPGRGSAAASVVCYFLGITHIDPIEYKLDFNRFLIEGRVSLPDIDMDIERTGKDRILARLKKLVGEDHVAKIGTFHYMHEKGALRDVARALVDENPEIYKDLVYEINVICNLIPHLNKLPLKDLVRQQGMSYYYRRYPKLFKIAAALVGQPRHVSIHPAGVIIANRPIREILPLQRKEEATNTSVVQWGMKDTDKMGLFKLDLLVLDVLDFITECCELAGVEVDKIEPTDPSVFEAFAAGDVTGIFQFDKSYVGEIFKKVKVDRFDDLVAINALLRPGAKSTNSVDEYAKRKHTPKNKVEQLRGRTIHPKAWGCLIDTHGLILYQEQAMKIARECAGFDVREADDLRKGIAKDYDTSRMRGKFLTGCHKNGLNETESHTLWKILENAGSYMFNKAHSTCYSYISYQQMWLKVHHPTAFWIAMINSFLEDEVMARKTARRMRSMGMKIRTISINRSKAKCWYDSKKEEVILGFLCIKGIGIKAALELERCRDAIEAETWGDTIDRRVINKNIIDLLITNGVFSRWSRDEEHLREALRKKSKAERERMKVDQMYLDF